MVTARELGGCRKEIEDHPRRRFHPRVDGGEGRDREAPLLDVVESDDIDIARNGDAVGSEGTSKTPLGAVFGRPSPSGDAFSIVALGVDMRWLAICLGTVHLGLRPVLR